MIFTGDELPCAQCNDMVDVDMLDDDGLCSDCAYENGLVSDIIEDQPEWVQDLPATYGSSAFISSS